MGVLKFILWVVLLISAGDAASGFVSLDLVSGITGEQSTSLATVFLAIIIAIGTFANTKPEDRSEEFADRLYKLENPVSKSQEGGKPENREEPDRPAKDQLNKTNVNMGDVDDC